MLINNNIHTRLSIAILAPLGLRVSAKELNVLFKTRKKVHEVFVQIFVMCVPSLIIG